jgi:hypothetical protein
LVPLAILRICTAAEQWQSLIHGVQHVACWQCDNDLLVVYCNLAPLDGGDVQDNGWPPSLNRKDATAFIKAVKRYGLEARLAKIAAEVGPVMEEAPEEAK